MTTSSPTQAIMKDVPSIPENVHPLCAPTLSGPPKFLLGSSNCPMGEVIRRSKQEPKMSLLHSNILRALQPKSSFLNNTQQLDSD